MTFVPTPPLPPRAEADVAEYNPWPTRLIFIGAAAVVGVASFIFGVRFLPNPPQPVEQPIAAIELPKPVPPRKPALSDAQIAAQLAREAAATPPAAPHAAPKPAIKYDVVRTAVLGSTTGGWPFETVRLRDATVHGFRAVTADWMGRSILRTLEPIYSTDNIVPTASVYLARPGYTVGGLILAGDQDVQAMQILFVRQTGDTLDPADSYRSPWIGTPATARQFLLGGHGEAVIGIYGRHGMNMDALGLILRRPAATATDPVAAAN